MVAGRLATRFAVALCAGAVLAAPAPAAPSATPVDRSASYRYRTIDWIGPVGSLSAVNAINELGDIVGTFDDANLRFHGLVGRADGTGLHELNFPGASQTVLAGISNLRVISGTYVDAGGLQHAFTYRNGTFTSIDAPGAGTVGTGFEFGDGLGTSGFGVDDLGRTVGQYADTQGVGHGFVRRNGRITTLDHPGQGPLPGGFAGGTGLVRINDLGEIAGNYSTSPAPEDTHPFLYRHGRFTDVPPIAGAGFTEFLGLSNTGVGSGVYFTDPLNSLAGAGFIYARGRLSSIRVPKAAPEGFSTVAQPNAQGVIVGEYLGADLMQHGYVGTPK
jgi:uncharacterized membrane protein